MTQCVNRNELPSKFAGADAPEYAPHFPQNDEMCNPPLQPRARVYKPDSQLPMETDFTPMNLPATKRALDDSDDMVNNEYVHIELSISDSKIQSDRTPPMRTPQSTERDNPQETPSDPPGLQTT